ncbi:MAG: hypothetical protein KDD40_04650 [Bdellovibrionales bacterium]|nr:hypothetical protein [Bdellovibrionales bacterium]
MNLKPLALIALIFSLWYLPQAKAGGGFGVGNGQLYVKVNGHWVTIEFAMAHLTTTFYGLDDLVANENNRTGKNFAKHILNWLEQVKKYDPFLYSILINEANKRTVVYVKAANINIPVEAYPQLPVEFEEYKKAALYFSKDGKIYVSQEALDSVQGVGKISKGDQQGITFLHEYINSAFVNNNYPNLYETASRIKLGTLFVQAKMYNWSQEEYLIANFSEGFFAMSYPGFDSLFIESITKKLTKNGRWEANETVPKAILALIEHHNELHTAWRKLSDGSYPQGLTAQDWAILRVTKNVFHRLGLDIVVEPYLSQIQSYGNLSGLDILTAPEINISPAEYIQTLGQLVPATYRSVGSYTDVVRAYDHYLKNRSEPESINFYQRYDIEELLALFNSYLANLHNFVLGDSSVRINIDYIDEYNEGVIPRFQLLKQLKDISEKNDLKFLELFKFVREIEIALNVWENFSSKFGKINNWMKYHPEWKQWYNLVYERLEGQCRAKQIVCDLENINMNITLKNFTKESKFKKLVTSRNENIYVMFTEDFPQYGVQAEQVFVQVCPLFNKCFLQNLENSQQKLSLAIKDLFEPTDYSYYLKGDFVDKMYISIKEGSTSKAVNSKALPANSYCRVHAELPGC